MSYSPNPLSCGTVILLLLSGEQKYRRTMSKSLSLFSVHLSLPMFLSPSVHLISVPLIYTVSFPNNMEVSYLLSSRLEHGGRRNRISDSERLNKGSSKSPAPNPPPLIHGQRHGSLVMSPRKRPRSRTNRSRQNTEFLQESSPSYGRTSSLWASLLMNQPPVSHPAPKDNTKQYGVSR